MLRMLSGRDGCQAIWFTCTASTFISRAATSMSFRLGSRSRNSSGSQAIDRADPPSHAKYPTMGESNGHAQPPFGSKRECVSSVNGGTTGRTRIVNLKD